jgi:hypothetical protein
MARAAKRGLDYFPVDVDMDEDDKLYAIEASHRDGFKIVMKLLMSIYRDGGYYKDWSEGAALTFAGRKGIPIEDVKAVVQTSTEIGFFSTEMYQRHGILTSSGIQRRYVGGTQKRDRICLYTPYVLISEHEFTDAIRRKLVFSTEMTFSGEKTRQVSTASTQREGGSKGREEREGVGERETNEPPPAASAGLERPAGQPADEQPPEPDAAPEPADSAIPLHELPPLLRTATAQARAKLEADAKRKSEYNAQKTSDYHAMLQPARNPCAPKSPAAPATPGEAPPPERAPPEQGGNSDSVAVDDFEDFPEVDAT